MQQFHREHAHLLASFVELVDHVPQTLEALLSVGHSALLLLLSPLQSLHLLAEHRRHVVGQLPSPLLGDPSDLLDAADETVGAPRGDLGVRASPSFIVLGSLGSHARIQCLRLLAVVDLVLLQLEAQPSGTQDGVADPIQHPGQITSDQVGTELRAIQDFVRVQGVLQRALRLTLRDAGHHVHEEGGLVREGPLYPVTQCCNAGLELLGEGPALRT
mmetsp:Transcript_91720/g.247813  ORF Transcript_91720/g.247813 Transcript_91720/m.247813 type:complete len:216 (+) Transcript_91720:269-916(+)